MGLSVIILIMYFFVMTNRRHQLYALFALVLSYHFLETVKNSIKILFGESIQLKI